MIIGFDDPIMTNSDAIATTCISNRMDSGKMRKSPNRVPRESQECHNIVANEIGNDDNLSDALAKGSVAASI